MSWLVALLCLTGTAAFALWARLLGEEGTAFPTAPFGTLIVLDLVAVVLAGLGLSVGLAGFSPPAWSAAAALIIDLYGGFELYELFRRRTGRRRLQGGRR